MDNITSLSKLVSGKIWGLQHFTSLRSLVYRFLFQDLVF